MSIGVGTRLRQGRFEILGRIGEGGTGVVYEVRDHESGARLALKTVRSSEPESLASLKREFRAAQDLAHPNLIRLDELFEEDGSWFFTMELVDGVSWLAYVRNDDEKRFDEARLRMTLVRIFEALEALHAAGTLHRDIKPSNVLVTRDGQVKLLDFGIAFRERHIAADEGIVGTIAYMPPEQLLSAPPTPAGDFYSVGVMLHEALTGELPSHEGDGDIMTRKVASAAAPVKQLAPDVPADLGDLCDALLQTEAEDRPTSAAILRMLGARVDLRSARPAADREVLVGRAAELEELRRAFAEAAAGETVTCIVSGASGVGKSAIVRHFLSELRDRALVLEGKCHAREYVPYKGLDAIVEDLAELLLTEEALESSLAAVSESAARLLPRLFPALERVPIFAEARARGSRDPATDLDPVEVRARVFDAFRELVARVTQKRRVVLAIDDIQWADGDSLALLAHLLAPPAPALLLVCTRRLADGEEAPPLPLPGARRTIAIGGLDAGDAAALARHLAGDAAISERALVALQEESGGHPLFLQELVRRRSDGAEPGADVRLDDVLWHRVAALDREERSLVEAVAVAGAPVALVVIASAAQIEMRALPHHLARLRGANLLKVGGRDAHNVEPYHDRVREAVVQKLVPEAKRALHERLARALESLASADAETLFVHWRGAGFTREAAAYAERAADAAERALAFEHAAYLFAEAIALRVALGEATYPLHRRRAAALANAGRSVEAARAYQTAAEEYAGENVFESLDLRRRAAQHLLSAGLIDEGLDVAREVLSAFGMSLPRTPVHALVSLLFHRFLVWLRGLRFTERPESSIPQRQLVAVDLTESLSLSLVMVDILRGADFQARALLLSLAAGEPTRIACALAAEASFGAMSGRVPWRVTEARMARASALAKRVGDPRANAMAAAHEGVAAYSTGRYARARARLDESLERLAACTGVWGEITRVRYFLMNTIADQGDILELRRRVPLYLREAQEHGDRYGQTTFRTGQAALVWLARDDPEGAHADIADALAHWSKDGFHVEHFDALVGHMESDLYAGDARAAWERIVGAWKPLRRSLLLGVQVARVYAFYMRARAALAVAALDSRLRGARLAEARRLARRCMREKTPFSSGAAFLLDASAAAITGDSERAIALFDEASARLEASGNRLHACVARHAAAAHREGGATSPPRLAEEDAMRARGIVAPLKFVRMIAPGALPSRIAVDSRPSASPPCPTV